jgi:hypothetical protein
MHHFRVINGMEKLVHVDRLRNNTLVGDPLTDNSYGDNGYRFHDVLHLAFAALLGWSPVWRKLLRKAGLITNRTEPPGIADAQDGGRAQVIDEAIVAAAYVYASRHSFLEGAEVVDWKLLNHIKQMTADLEVSDRTTREWNDAILRGFEMWRQLRTHNGGIIRGNLLEGTIQFIPPA